MTEVNDNPVLKAMAEMFITRLRSDSKVKRCHHCGRVLPHGYDDVEAHSPRCPWLITYEPR